MIFEDRHYIADDLVGSCTITDVDAKKLLKWYRKVKKTIRKSGGIEFFVSGYLNKPLGSVPDRKSGGTK